MPDFHTWRPRRSSSLWMATADTHLLSPPPGAAVMDSRAMRLVAPWSEWKARRVMSILLLSILVYPSCFAAARQAKCQRAEQSRAQQSRAEQSTVPTGNASQTSATCKLGSWGGRCSAVVVLLTTGHSHHTLACSLIITETH